MAPIKQGLTDYTNVVQRVSQNLKNLMPNTSSASLTSRNKVPQITQLQHPLSQMSSSPASNTFLNRLTGISALNVGSQLQRGPSITPFNGGQKTNLSDLMNSGPSTWGDIKKRNAAQAAAQASTSSGSGVGDPSGARGLDGSLKYKSTMMEAQNETGTPWQVLAAIMGIESGGENLSANSSGAAGVMQIVGSYWQDLANKYGGNLMDPTTNIKTAAAILKQNYDKYGSWEQAAAAYLGAIDANGNITGAQDSFGTDGFTYVSLFKNNLAALGYGSPSSAEAASGGAPASSWGGMAVQQALNLQGTPYVWGGEDTNGFDCSGLVQYVYGNAGKQMARTAQGQYDTTQHISADQLQPGDLIFFKFPPGSVQPGQENIVNHVAIYIGNGQFVQASSNGGVVGIRSLSDDWYAQNIYGYGRVT